MAQNYIGILHAHGFLWILAILLFFLTIVFINSGKAKPAKIMQMTLRLLYVIFFITGVLLIYINDFQFYVGQFHWESYVKGALAFWLIYVMEMITSRMAKGTLNDRAKMIYWIQFALALVLVLYFGYVVI